MKKLSAFGLTLLILVSALRADESVTLRLKWKFQFQFAGIIMAKEKGFYAKEGLDVHIVERDPRFNHIEQVLKGKNEYGIADSSIIYYRLKGKPVKLIAPVFQHNAMVLIAHKDSGIVSPYDLVGKTISYQEGIDDAIFSSIFRFANLKAGQYTKLPMDFTYERFINREMDVIAAYITDQPYWIEKRGYPLTIINPLSYGIDLYGDLLFTTDTEVAEHPDRVQKMKQATIQGWDYALKHQEETIRILRQKYCPDLDAEQLRYEAKATERLISPYLIPLGNVSVDRLKAITAMYAPTISSEQTETLIGALYYDPNAKHDHYELYIKALAIALLLIAAVTALLFGYNRHLGRLVYERTLELERMNKNLDERVNREIEKRREQEHILIEQNRMAAMGEMIGNIAHQWRQPLNSLGLAVQDVEEAYQYGELNDAYVKRYIATAMKQINYMSRTIDDFRNFFNPQKQKRAFPLAQAAADIFNILNAKIKRFNVDYTVEIPESTKLYGYQNEFAQVLVNLISNAIDAASEKRIETPQIRIKASEDANGATITVSDNAGGIPETVLPRIFDPYFTTKEEGKGSGIGLYMSKMIIEQHMGGELHVRNSTEGAVFTILLPPMPDETSLSAADAPIPS